MSRTIAMLGLVFVLVACDTPGTDAEIDAAHQCTAIVIVGQSNARGSGLSSEVSSEDIALLTPFTDVLEVVRMGNNAYPPTWTEYPLSPMQPRTYSGGIRFGFEITLARDLHAARPDLTFVIIKATLDATSLAGDWDPTNVAHVPNQFTLVYDWIADELAATGCAFGAELWEQGENDAGGSGTANMYGDNLVKHVDAVRARFGDVQFVIGRLNAAYQGVYTSAVRDGEDALPFARSGALVVDQDAFPLRGTDHTHYTTASVIALGHVFAGAVLSIARAP